MKAKQTIGYRGKVRVLQVDNETGKIVTDKEDFNMITHQGLAVMNSYLGVLFRSISFNKGAHGNLFVNSGCNLQEIVDYQLQYKGYDEGLNMYGINDATAVPDDIKYPPFINDDFTIDDTKLTFFANGRVDSTATKEGDAMTMNYASQEFLMDFNKTGFFWKIPPLKGNGDFNKIAISKGCHTLAGMLNGGMISKHISVDPAQSTLPFSFYSLPNITGVTSANEILLGLRAASEYDVEATHVFNLSTGILTALEVGDPRLDIDLGNACCGQCIVDNKWFRADLSFLKIRDLTTNVENNVNIPNIAMQSVFTDGSLVYVMSKLSPTITAYDFSGVAQTGSNKVLATLEATLPADITDGIIAITTKGSNYLVTCGKWDDTYYPYGNNIVLECTDIDDIGGSIIGMYNSNSGAYISNGVDEWFVGYERKGSDAKGTANCDIRDINHADSGNLNLKDEGMRLISGNSGNLLSILDLGETYTHSSSVTTYIGYYYEATSV